MLMQIWAIIHSNMLSILTRAISMRRTLYNRLTNSMSHCYPGTNKQKYSMTGPRHYHFNQTFPLARVTTNRFAPAGHAQREPYFRINGSKNLILDWVKKAEDSDCVIVRVYEAYGGRSVGTLQTLLPVRKAARSNFLEDDTEDYFDVQDNNIKLTLDAFQVLTIKLHLKR